MIMSIRSPQQLQPNGYENRFLFIYADSLWA